MSILLKGRLVDCKKSGLSALSVIGLTKKRQEVSRSDKKRHEVPRSVKRLFFCYFDVLQ